MAEHVLLQLQGTKNEIIKSIVEIDVNNQEDLFLFFSPGTTNGPPISRTGKGSPQMVHPIWKMGAMTPDADLQRYGAMEIDENTRDRDCARIKKRLAAPQESPGEHQELTKLKDDIENQRTYMSRFEEFYGKEFSLP